MSDIELFAEARQELSSSQASGDSMYTDFEMFSKDCLEFLSNAIVDALTLSLLNVILVKGYLIQDGPFKLCDEWPEPSESDGENADPNVPENNQINVE